MIDEYRTSSNGKFRWEAFPMVNKDADQNANSCKVDKIQNPGLARL